MLIGDINSSVDNSTPNQELTGTSEADLIKNSGAYVKIYTLDGNDTINNSANLVTISAGDHKDNVTNTGSNVQISLDANDDYVRNSNNSDVVIYGGTGKDSVYNSSDNVTIYGGAGNDSVYNSSGKNVFVSGDEGNDYISNYDNSNVTISGGAGKDTIENYAANKISIYGGEGNDSIYTYGYNVTINGGAGSDIISLTNDSHNRVIQYVYGDGDDTIFRFNSKDTLQITTPKDFENMRGGNDLYILFDNGSITLKDVTTANVVTIAGGSVDVGTTSTNTTSTTTTTPSTTTTSTETTTTQTTTTTTTTTTEETTTTTTATQAAETSASTTPSVTNNYYYGDVYNVNDNNGTVVIGSNVTGSVTNTTNIDNSKNIVISGNTWTYSGGDKVINNYQQGEVVRLDSDYQGIDLQGNSFFVKSSSGSLEIENARDKFIGYSADNDDVAVYSYVAGGAGAVDGRDKSQAEMMIGAENSDNQIYAGSGGSSMWGGNGGNDIMTGGDGYDEFFYAIGSGNDVVQNASDNDVINLLGVSLSQITYAEVHQSEINIGFTDGGNLKLQGQAATGFRLEGVVYAADRSTGGWRMKN